MCTTCFQGDARILGSELVLGAAVKLAHVKNLGYHGCNGIVKELDAGSERCSVLVCNGKHRGQLANIKKTDLVLVDPALVSQPVGLVSKKPSHSSEEGHVAVKSSSSSKPDTIAYSTGGYKQLKQEFMEKIASRNLVRFLANK